MCLLVTVRTIKLECGRNINCMNPKKKNKNIISVYEHVCSETKYGVNSKCKRWRVIMCPCISVQNCYLKKTKVKNRMFKRLEIVARLIHLSLHSHSN